MKEGSALGVALILVGCCLNLVTLELLNNGDRAARAKEGREKGMGDLLTCAQFTFVALCTLPSQLGPGLVPRRPVVPFRYYALLVAIFWVLSVVNNGALSYGISIPLHTIFRSCSLVASLVMGMAFFGKSYPPRKIAACALVTVGIVVATLADANMRAGPAAACCGDAAGPDGCQDDCDAAASAAGADLARWTTGVAMLLGALLLSALLGHLQQLTYDRFGREWRENLFWSHFLALPGFALVWGDMAEHWEMWCRADPVRVSAFGASADVGLPALLAVNCVLQLVCINGVFILTSHAGTLTCTLTLTARKFLSLVFSVLYFSNPFTPHHWAGTALVFAGVLLYSWPAAGKVKTQ